MEAKEFNQLISDKPQDVKMRGTVLFNASIKTLDDYNKDRTVANLRNMEAAKEALDKFIAEAGGGKAGENFSNIAAVVKYLEDAGWKISDKTLYRHINVERKLLRQEDGTFTRKAVDTYAATWLKQTATGKRKQDSIDQLQRQKLEQELENLKQRNEREKFNFEKDKGLHVPKEQMEIELATRAGVLLAGLKHWIQANTADWITLSGGDTRKVGELINKMTNDLDDHINRYAGSHEYEVVIEAADPETQGAVE